MSSPCTCGCCEGIAIAVPQPTANRPGLPALDYRVGTHATFLATMLARLSAGEFPALAALRTRDPADPAVALCDSWALVADVLSFYQERIINEGYLRTAKERRSILELAGLIGYKFRPGVAATVYLAYTLEQDLSRTPPIPTRTVIAAGSRCQSVPGPGEMPQVFETSVDLEARSPWNNLLPRLTHPQLFTLRSNAATDAALRDRVYFSGIATNLHPGDPLLIALRPEIDPERPQQFLRWVQSVEIQSDQQRTLVNLQPVVSSDRALMLVRDTVERLVQEARTRFPAVVLAAQASSLLTNPTPPGLIERLIASPDQSGAFAATAVQETVADLDSLHTLAVNRSFNRLEPWLAAVMAELNALARTLRVLNRRGARERFRRDDGNDASPLSNLTALIPSLARPPALQFANSSSLPRSTTAAFASGSDIAPRLLGAFVPEASASLYAAWARLVHPSEQTQAGAIRVKTGLFPGRYPGTTVSTNDGNGNFTTSYADRPTIDRDWRNIVPPATPTDPGVHTIALDSLQEKILAGSFVLIDRPRLGVELRQAPNLRRQRTIHEVTAITHSSMTTANGGFSDKVTQLTLDPPWLAEPDAPALRDMPALLPNTVVFAQTEMLELAEEPITANLAGATLELGKLYEGLESGRWIIVSGERTDIPGVTGVSASELAMIQGVTQDQSANGTRPGAIHTILTLARPLAYAYAPATVVIHGNVVPATHGETRREALGNGDGSQAFQQFALKQKPVTFVPAPKPSGVESTLEVYVNNIQWHEMDTLAGLGAKDRAFIVKAADDDTATVIFGNGRAGARLPTGAGNVMAVYRNGIGRAGNVGAGQITLLQTRPLNVKEVLNPLRASGGADRDSAEMARRNVPLAVLALDRLVSVRDYEDFSRTFAGIGKATAISLPGSDGSVVYVTIAGVDDIPIDRTSGLYANLLQALQLYGDPHLPVQLGIRNLRLLVISANVRILPDYLWEPVALAVRSALIATFGFAQRELGQPVFRSEVIAAIQAVAGVAYVDLETFDAVAEADLAENAPPLGGILQLRDVIRANPARPNPTPLDPAERIQPAELLYLSPTIPDLLILNEVKP